MFHSGGDRSEERLSLLGQRRRVEGYCLFFFGHEGWVIFSLLTRSMMQFLE
ncbi:hypothetical protein HanPSC8_Chr15g0674541 [Helianthus annuus]|nr:hypothetical protein HanPSC8_Chr15g0674541 [Helianthus annuus]